MTQVSFCLLAPTTNTSHAGPSAGPGRMVRSNWPLGKGNIVRPNKPPRLARATAAPITPPTCMGDTGDPPRGGLARPSGTDSGSGSELNASASSDASVSSSFDAAARTGWSSTQTERLYTPATVPEKRSSQAPFPSSSVSQVTLPGPVPTPWNGARPSRLGTRLPNRSARVTVSASCFPAVQRLCAAPSTRQLW